MQPVKRRSSGNGLIALKNDIYAKLMEWDEGIRRKIDDLKYKLNHLPETNFELGKKFAEEGRVSDAVFRFKMATYFAPNYTQAWYNLGCCLIAQDKQTQAVAALRKTLQLDPAHADAKFMLATIDPTLLAPQDRPQRMPAHMVESFFSKIAAQYDMIEGANGYDGPQHFHARVKGQVPVAMDAVLDLGCGTGLSAMPWRKQTKLLVGAEMVPAMVDRARQARLESHPVFDEVLMVDANNPHAVLPQGTMDLVIALNVLPFIGECSAFVTHAARALKQGGIFAVTFEPYVQQNGFGVVPATSRFGHGVDYIRQLGAAAGFTLVAQDTVPLYETTRVPLLVFSRSKA